MYLPENVQCARQNSLHTSALNDNNALTASKPVFDKPKRKGIAAAFSIFACVATLVLVCFLAPKTSLTNADGQLLSYNATPSYSLNFYGKIGKYPVQMEIYVYANGYIEGNYFYESQGPYNRLAIIGNKSGKSIRLDEYNDKGQRTGTFNGTYSGGVYSGTFTNYKGKKFNFKLTSY